MEEKKLKDLPKLIEINKEINGPQSKVLIFTTNGKKYVEKIATERGEQELLDQIEFYANIPQELSTFFPKMLEYSSVEKPFRMQYEYCDLPTLKEIFLNEKFDGEVNGQLIILLKRIQIELHSIQRCLSHEEYVEDTYIKRCNSRVDEVKNLISINVEWLDDEIYIKGKKRENPILELLNLFREMSSQLIPEFLCTVHGQLGPSHVLISKYTDDIKLLDPKGFKTLHDPLIDFIKIGRTMLFGMEWLEDDLFNIDFSIKGGRLHIKSYKIVGYNQLKIASMFNDWIDLASNTYKNAKLRIFALISADLLSNLPFSYKAGGLKRTVMMLCILTEAIDALKKVKGDPTYVNL